MLGMSFRLGVKQEERKTPSLRPTGTTQHAASFSLPPPPRDMANHIKVEEPGIVAEGPLSPFSFHAMDVKLEPKTQRPLSPPALPKSNDNNVSPQNMKPSPSPTPPPSTTDGTVSMSSTPPPSTPATVVSKKAQAAAVQLIGDLPVARDEALATFNEITQNNYQFKTLGRSREALESMTCDCIFDPRLDDPDLACGLDSDCINRLTQVECLPDDCRCGTHCRNQRFQQREYSNIEIVLTEKKGFGLRAETSLRKDAFIYEYVGDVVNPASFKKRMREYASEGIQHFYFMMLQKDEFIDATKSGGLGRFANHSCRPNCYVARWTIDQHVRMGIFAKRDIQKHEELTFNYNVDRYGHQAQICHCGEPNCVGYIGGKTQTDVATMDDLYLDALGITDEAEIMEIKGTKKKKGKKIDDPDFMPTLKPITEKDVPKVVQAMRQTQNRKVLSKLITRIKITHDQASLRQIMRLRGYSVMTNILDDHASDTDLIKLALECMSTWPLLNRNKVDDSKVIVAVRVIVERESSTTLGDLAQSLIDHWETLPRYNRIPKRIVQDGEKSDDDVGQTYEDDEYLRPLKRTKTREEVHFENWRKHLRRPIVPPFFGDPPPKKETSIIHTPPSKVNKDFSRENIRAVIAAAAEAKTLAEEKALAETAAAEAAAAEAEAKLAKRAAKAAALAANGQRKKSRHKKPLTDEEKEANKEKRLTRLVGPIVVRCMSKHSNAMVHDVFKKHAKELTHVIVEKEKKSSSYKEGRLDKLSDEKVVKIKKFAKEYIAKVLYRLEKSGGKRPGPLPTPSPSSAQASTSTPAQETPNSIDNADIDMAEITMGDFGVVSESDDDGESEGEGEVNDEGNDGPQDMDSENAPQRPPPVAGPSHETEADIDMESSQHPGIQPPADPRRRPPIETGSSS